MKKCKKCDTEKSYDEFHKDKYAKDGHRGSCKICDKIYKDKNKDNIRDYLKKYSKTEKRKAYMEKYRDEKSDILSEKRKSYYEREKDSILSKQKEYYEKNKDNINEKERDKYHKIENKELFNKIKNDKSKEYRKEYYEKNKDVIINKQKLYYIENKESIYKYREDYKPIRNEKRRIEYMYKMNNDKLFYLKESIRSCIKQSFKRKGFKKISNTQNILGCSFLEFKLYLESKFEDWMTWENRGLYNGELNYGWDIDHIIPISSAITEEDIIRLNHYTNLQPLCAYINRVIKKDLIT
jgi:hypothetical protein